MIGLKRGTIKLCDHEKEWEREAQDTIIRLKMCLVMVQNSMCICWGGDVPVREYTASIIGIIYREDDVEDKLVAAPL